MYSSIIKIVPWLIIKNLTNINCLIDVNWPLYVYLFYILCKRRAAAVHQLICTIDIADCSKTRNLEIYYNNSHSYQYDIIAITVFFVAPK